MNEQMKETELYIGKGHSAMQDDYMDFINYVFGFNGTAKDFYKLDKLWADAENVLFLLRVAVTSAHDRSTSISRALRHSEQQLRLHMV